MVGELKNDARKSAKSWIFTFIIAAVAMIIYKINHDISSVRKEFHVQGFVHPNFTGVRDAFINNFNIGWERDGASFSAYHKGEKVVDLWGGYADVSVGRKWKENTMSIAFSSSKTLGAICIALLVDQGHLKYEDKIAKYWPSFAQNGKENITIQMVMSHTSGLVLIDAYVEIEYAMDHLLIQKIIEEQTPYWEPGTQIGYHAISYGWIVDQIIIHVDPKKRTIGKFFKEEITDVHGIDAYLGLPNELAYRVSKLSSATLYDRIDEYITNTKSADYWHVAKDVVSHGYLSQMSQNPEWLQSIFKMTLNNPDVYAVEQCAALGIGTARAFAKLFNKLMKGEIISPELVKKISTPYTGADKDVVTGASIARGYGFTFIPFTLNNEEHMIIGHAGLGGQNIRFDPKKDLAFSYLSNGMKSGLGDLARTYLPLRDAVYNSVHAMSNN
uniref:Beta-lactamase domain-containing protein n=1 Tax=Rhabditophanes sp. KR3021 TaxID=114890 RepID=A0AC35U601_9BILA